MRKQIVVLLFAMFGSLVASLPVSAQSVDIFSDGDRLRDTIGGIIGCDLSARLKADMPIEPLFSNAGSSCVEQVPRDTGEYFTDSQCLESVLFTHTRQQQFCADALDSENLGNGASIDTNWTLSPGVRYDIGAKRLDGVTHPYRTSVSYRSVNTPRGECQLEMRVYKNSIASTEQYPLIAFHGGSWKARGFGTMGIESVAAHYTSKGFVVFAPFYRLLGDSEPNVECQSATIADIINDAEFALQWVSQNGATYGARGKPVVMGQSAGGHLALSLAVNKSDQVAAAVLMYPPTDFTDFVSMVLAGEYSNEEGLNIFNDVLGTDAAQADVSLPPIPENSYPARVAVNPASYPPMVMFHGLVDELVPASQSLRLCNALAGRALDEGYDQAAGLQQTIDCGNDSALHLFKEGNHALDVCLTNNDLLTAVCPSGGRESREAVAALLDQTTDFVQTQAAVSAQASTNQGGGGALGIVFYIASVMLAMFRIRRLAFGSCCDSPTYAC